MRKYIGHALRAPHATADTNTHHLHSTAPPLHATALLTYTMKMAADDDYCTYHDNITFFITSTVNE